MSGISLLGDDGDRNIEFISFVLQGRSRCGDDDNGMVGTCSRGGDADSDVTALFFLGDDDWCTDSVESLLIVRKTSMPRYFGPGRSLITLDLMLLVTVGV